MDTRNVAPPAPMKAHDEAYAVVPVDGVVTLADVPPRRVDWLWSGRLPAGKLVVFDGDPGTGKSTVCLDVAARITRGSLMPDGTKSGAGGPADVVLLTAEDGLDDTVRPRADAAGADVRRLHVMVSAPAFDDDGNRTERPPSIPADVPQLEKVVTDTGAVLVVVDVLYAFLHGKVDAYRDTDVRGALAPLAAMAERTGATVVLLRHLTKGGGGQALYRGGGSIGIAGAARCVWIAGNDPDDDSARVLAVSKSNLARLPDALGYRLADSPEHGCARVEWTGTVGHKADDLVRSRGDDDERSERDEASDWLAAYLTAHGGQARAADVVSAARRDGIAERTLRRARSRAGVESVRQGFGEGALWRLAEHHSGHPDVHSGHSGPSTDVGMNGTNGHSGGTNGERCTRCDRLADRLVPALDTDERWCPTCCLEVAP